jgi:hypothetical protein
MLAAEVLSEASDFEGAQVGPAGTTPDVVLAWRIILFSSQRAAVFRHLLQTAMPAGQLYALAGLRTMVYMGELDSVTYEMMSSHLRAQRDSIMTLDGCVPVRRAWSSVVDHIDSGETGRALMGVPRP